MIAPKTNMKVKLDEVNMYMKFGGQGLSGFRDFAPFQIWPNFPFRPWTIVHGGQKIESAQKIHASRG